MCADASAARFEAAFDRRDRNLDVAHHPVGDSVRRRSLVRPADVEVGLGCHRSWPASIRRTRARGVGLRLRAAPPRSTVRRSPWRVRARRGDRLLLGKPVPLRRRGRGRRAEVRSTSPRGAALADAHGGRLGLRACRGGRTSACFSSAVSSAARLLPRAPRSSRCCAATAFDGQLARCCDNSACVRTQSSTSATAAARQPTRLRLHGAGRSRPPTPRWAACGREVASVFRVDAVDQRGSAPDSAADWPARRPAHATARRSRTGRPPLWTRPA